MSSRTLPISLLFLKPGSSTETAHYNFPQTLVFKWLPLPPNSNLQPGDENHSSKSLVPFSEFYRSSPQEPWVLSVYRGRGFGELTHTQPGMQEHRTSLTQLRSKQTIVGQQVQPGHGLCREEKPDRGVCECLPVPHLTRSYQNPRNQIGTSTSMNMKIQ